MLLQIQNVLEPAEVATLLAKSADAAFVDGALTAGPRARRVKRNLQMPADAALGADLRELVLAALARNPLFQCAAFPRRVTPPLFNRYAEGMLYGNHVDNPLMGKPDDRIRTDVSATLFLSDPADYDGGELVIQDNYGFHAVKLAPGNMILYPSTSIHRVEPVTRGVRNAVVFWVQSAVRDADKRRLLFDLDMAVQRLTGLNPDNPEIGNFTACYSNLMRMWAEA
jgi:PKHD-type hydroxylase